MHAIADALAIYGALLPLGAIVFLAWHARRN